MAPSWEIVAAGAGAAALGGAGLALRRLLSEPRPEGVPVLRYRLVGPPLPGSPLNDLRVPVSRFEAQVRHVARRGYTAVTLEEAVKGARSRAFLARNPIAFTFDGPYVSTGTVAWPILHRYGLARATLFYPPARLGQRELRFTEGRPEPILTPDQLQALARDGLSLGVQASLAEAASYDEQVAELRAGRQALSDVTGAEVGAVALPLNERLARRASRAAGFQVAAVLGDGVVTRRTPRYSIPRYAVQPNTELVEVALVIARRMGKTEW